MTFIYYLTKVMNLILNLSIRGDFQYVFKQNFEMFSFIL